MVKVDRGRPWAGADVGKVSSNQRAE